MRFFEFLESKFTIHSVNQQQEFSILADGEQKSSQTYIWMGRKLAKWWALIKLPGEFLVCLIGIKAFPEKAPVIMQQMIEAGRIKQEEMRKQQEKLKLDQSMDEDNVKPLKPVDSSK